MDQDILQLPMMSISTPSQTGRDYFSNILTGRLSDLPPIPVTCVKIYVSSNTSDFKSERLRLWQDTFPDIQHHFLHLGLDVIWVDPHHGADTDHVYDHEAFHRHVLEISECCNQSVGPFFLCLLGNKYGSCPLPHVLDEKEFKHIRNEAFDGGKDIKLLDEWFVRCDNVVPVVYRLKSTQSAFKYYPKGINEDFHRVSACSWMDIYATLLDLIQHGAKVAYEEGFINQVHIYKQQRFFTSGIEQEIVQAFDLSPKGCVFMLRNVEGISTWKRKNSCLIDITNNALDTEKQKHLQDLREEIAARANDSNKHSFTIPWKKDGITLSDITAQKDYLENFSAAAATKLKQLVDQSMKQRAHKFSSDRSGKIYLEALAHLQYCKNIAGSFCDSCLDETLSKIQSLLLTSSRTDHPVVLIKGADGGGKSTLMAKICHEVLELFGKETILIAKFCGLSPGMNYAEEILEGICKQMNLIFEQDRSIQSYDNYDLSTYYHLMINRLSHGSRHFVLVIDGLDQVRLTNASESLFDWLAGKLPPKVHVFISYGAYADLGIFHRLESKILSEDFIVQLPSWKEKQLEIVMHDMLLKSKHVLSAEQEKAILSALSVGGSPLLLKLLLELSQSWNASYIPGENDLPMTLTEALNKKMNLLEETFGDELIAVVARYISLSKCGLTEAELLDLLSCNNNVLLMSFPISLPSVLRFPYTLWIQIRDGFGSLLTKCFMHNKTVFMWSHHCFVPVIQRRYLSHSEDIVQAHKHISQIFLETWIDNKPLIHKDRNIHIIDDGNRLLGMQPLLYSDTAYNMRRLQELWYQLLKAGDIESFKEYTFCNFEYILAMAHSSGIQEVIRNLKFVLTNLVDAEVFLIYNCLRKSIGILREDPLQLASELIGHLRKLSEFYQGYIDSLVTQCMQWCDGFTRPLLIPLTSWLPCPHVAQVMSITVMYRITCFVPSHNSQYLFCNHGQTDIAMHHLPSKRLIKLFCGHKGPLKCMILSHNNRFLVSGSADCTIRFWDISGKPFCSKVIREHASPVVSLSLVKKDEVLISGSEDKLIIVYNVTTGEKLHVLQGHAKAVTAIAVNNTETLLISAGRDAMINVWCMEEYKKLHAYKDQIKSPIISMALSVDNTFLLLGCEDWTLSVLSFTTGSWIHHLKGHDGKILSLDISVDCHHAVAGCSDNHVYLYNLRTTELLEVFKGQEGSVTQVCLSSDESFIFSASESVVQVWCLYKRFTKHILSNDHVAPVTCMAISTDGRTAVSGLHILDDRTLSLLCLKYVGDIDISVGSYDEQVKVWNMDSNTFLENFTSHQEPITCVDLSSDGAFAVSGSCDKTVKVWSMTLAVVIVNYVEHIHGIKRVCVLRDNMRVLSLDTGGEMFVWKADTGQTLRSYSTPADIFFVSPDSQYVITGHGDQSAKIWKLDTGAAVQTVNHVDRVTCLTCSKNAHFLITGSADRSVKVWELATGKITQILVEHDGSVICVTVTADDQHIASGDDSSTVMIWNVITGITKHKLLGHRDVVTSINTTVDSNLVISASRDNTLRVWSIMRGTQITLFDLHYPVIDFVMSSNLNRIIVRVEGNNHMPILCLHNNLTSDTSCSSMLSIQLSIDSSQELPIRPHPPLIHHSSIVFPIPKKLLRRKSSSSSIPQIIQGSPIKSKHLNQTKHPRVKQLKSRLTMGIRRGQHIEENNSGVCGIL